MCAIHMKTTFISSTAHHYFMQKLFQVCFNWLNSLGWMQQRGWRGYIDVDSVGFISPGQEQSTDGTIPPPIIEKCMILSLNFAPLQFL